MSCYVAALDRRDLSGLADLALVRTGEEITFTTAKDLKYAHDAAAGVPTATFQPNPVDSAFATIYLHFATGAHEVLNMTEQNPMATSWRLYLGTTPNTPSQTSGPGPVQGS